MAGRSSSLVSPPAPSPRSCVASPIRSTARCPESSIEIWHAVHAQYETRAPIITQEIRELDGVPTLIAVYACTPLVRIPLSELKDGAQIRGEMIGELGYGNTPLDIVSYTDPMDSKDYVLVTNSSRSAVRISLSDIASVEPMPVEVPSNFGPAGVNQFPIATEAVHLDMLNSYWGVAIRRSVDDPRQARIGDTPAAVLSRPGTASGGDELPRVSGSVRLPQI